MTCCCLAMAGARGTLRHVAFDDSNRDFMSMCMKSVSALLYILFYSFLWRPFLSELPMEAVETAADRTTSGSIVRHICVHKQLHWDCFSPGYEGYCVVVTLFGHFAYPQCCPALLVDVYAYYAWEHGAHLAHEKCWCFFFVSLATIFLTSTWRIMKY